MLTTVQDFPTVYIWVSFLSQIEHCIWLIIIVYITNDGHFFSVSHVEIQ